MNNLLEKTKFSLSLLFFSGHSDTMRVQAKELGKCQMKGCGCIVLEIVQLRMLHTKWLPIAMLHAIRMLPS